uniref:NSE2 (MMS21) homolog, SMC5-SMC6 complex SUMO ligase n=3 Tax=Sus scrofa TaxID=9823 RepID=A0A4X1SWG7_PIG
MVLAPVGYWMFTAVLFSCAVIILVHKFHFIVFEHLGNNFKMPGRASSSSGSTGFISFSGIESALSSLKNFQTCISSGMDTASSVALDLVETQTEVSSEYSMDKAMVEFAIMDRELNHYLKAVQSTINHVKEERPEKIPDLKLLVEEKFLALQNENSEADFQNNEKFVQFKQQLKELKKQCRCRVRTQS